MVAITALGTFSSRADTSTNLPPPTLEQRVTGLEAYIADSDPSASLKDTNGNMICQNLPVMNTAGPGHNAWMMTSTALVLFMTLPGLALFYGGMVRKKNVLSVLAQCFLITGLVTILWYICGFSMAFGPGTGAHGPFWGDLGTYAFFKGVTGAPGGVSTAWVSLDVFSCFQLTFAIITPALIIGSIAERMKFKAILVFMTLWMFVVYFPLAHMVWSTTGWMSGAANPSGATIKAIDFAGGTVVHMSSGWSAIVLCLILGKRLGFGKENFMPHSMVLTFIGTAMLWVGWYGFNAGSEVGSDGTAANAFTTTTLATAIASFVWPMWEWLVKGKPSVLGFCSGAVAGLVVITPACGWVNPTGAVWIGIAAGTIPWFMCYKVKGWLGYDDALDTFGVHAIGGTVGAIMTGFLCDASVNSLVPCQVNGVANHVAQVIEQFKAVGVTILLSTVGTVICAYITKVLVGLRPTEEVERAGLDESEHGELGYHG
ncbi:MAG TPA: ammonium transporter [Candidatus Paceibacterota bacterium]|nr:ammonium transporter [Candidatus Paceibacterota bacterium]